MHLVALILLLQYGWLHLQWVVPDWLQTPHLSFNLHFISENISKVCRISMSSQLCHSIIFAYSGGPSQSKFAPAYYHENTTVAKKGQPTRQADGSRAPWPTWAERLADKGTEILHWACRYAPSDILLGVPSHPLHNHVSLVYECVNLCYSTVVVL